MKWLKRGLLYMFFSILALILSLTYTGNCLNYYKDEPIKQENYILIPHQALQWIVDENPCGGKAEWVEYIRLEEHQAKNKNYDGYFMIICEDSKKYRMTFEY